MPTVFRELEVGGKCHVCKSENLCDKSKVVMDNVLRDSGLVLMIIVKTKIKKKKKKIQKQKEMGEKKEKLRSHHFRNLNSDLKVIMVTFNGNYKFINVRALQVALISSVVQGIGGTKTSHTSNIIHHLIIPSSPQSLCGMVLQLKNQFLFTK
jgi:hypothetical protein